MIMNDYKEFSNEIKKVKGPRIHKITNSYGVKEAYTYYNKHKPKEKKFIMKDVLFYKIIRLMNNALIDSLLDGNDLRFPANFGKLELRRYKLEPKLDDDGNLVYKAPIDWEKTLKFWHENEFARNNKILIKIEKHDNFKLIYNKSKAKYKNKSYVFFKANRAFRKKITQACDNKQLDAFEFKN